MASGFADSVSRKTQGMGAIGGGGDRADAEIYSEQTYLLSRAMREGLQSLAGGSFRNRIAIPPPAKAWGPPCYVFVRSNLLSRRWA